MPSQVRTAPPPEGDGDHVAPDTTGLNGVPDAGAAAGGLEPGEPGPSAAHAPRDAQGEDTDPIDREDVVGGDEVDDDAENDDAENDDAENDDAEN
ncbi:MAG TPA: hypothetical protein PKB06_08140, partial [Actinotalea sp.]|nr:hypothetical protein [Actinotalea sp.]